MYIKRGGGIINRKLLLSVLLLFGLALVLNVSTSAAVTVDKSAPKITSIDPVKNGVVGYNKIIIVKFSEPVKKGSKWIELRNNHGTLKTTKSTISGKTVSIIPTTPLSKGVKYNIILHTGSVTDLSGNKISQYSTSFSVTKLSLAQLKDGVARAQKFLIVNKRLPNFINYGSTKIPIATFQRIIASSGLKISSGFKVSAISAGTGKPVYITSDNIINSAIDNARINSIVSGLRSLGINAYNMGLGPNTHVQVLYHVPNNALIVDIYGGACAGTLYEMGTSWYKSLRSTKEVFTVFWPPAKYITGLPFLVRAHDDNFSPASFTGLAHPDQYLIKNGYNYLYSGDINHIISAIQYQALN
jgi:hypothetical protein